MAESKSRLLYILKYLLQNTDAEHYATTADILTFLKGNGFTIAIRVRHAAMCLWRRSTLTEICSPERTMLRAPCAKRILPSCTAL